MWLTITAHPMKYTNNKGFECIGLTNKSPNWLYQFGLERKNFRITFHDTCKFASVVSENLEQITAFAVRLDCEQKEYVLRMKKVKINLDV